MPSSFFTTDVLSVIEELNDLPFPVSSEPSTSPEDNRPDNSEDRTCRECGTELQDDEIECPQCGAINLDRKRRRRNRPTRELVREIDSENYNGRYKIYRNSDGSYSCTCLSFLFQRGVQNYHGFATCKHIRNCINDSQVNQTTFKPPTEWQKVALKRFGVVPHESLTDAQAYFVFEDLLHKQGVEYREYENLLIQYSNVSLLPIYSFGVEFEMAIRNKQELARKMLEAGIPVTITGYDHSLMAKWKIGTDASLREENGYQTIELVSPKLFGVEGFEQIRKVLRIADEVGCKVNRSCGTHVHIDAWNWDREIKKELLKVWAKIEVPFVWYLVSPSRRNGRYSKVVDEDYLLKVVCGQRLVHDDRYYSLNLRAFERHKTIEFRIHNGTTNSKKIIPWIIFCLKLVDAVKRGLKHTDITDTSFNAVMDAVGMDDSATSVIWDARNYLYGRYMHWKEDAEQNPHHVPDVIPPVVSGNIFRLRELENELRDIESLIYSSGIRYIQRRYRVTERNEELPANSVQNLANMIPSSVMRAENRLREGFERGVWTVPARTGNREYEVTLSREDDTLTCSCSAFRRENYCWHTINVARYIAIQRELQELERRAEEIRAEIERLQNENTAVAA